MRRTMAILLFVGTIWLWADRAHAIAFLSYKEEILYLRDLPPKARKRDASSTAPGNRFPLPSHLRRQFLRHVDLGREFCPLQR